MTLLLGLLALCGLALATGAAAIFAPTRWAFRYCLAVAMLALGAVAWAAPAFARLLDDHREGWQSSPSCSG
jgi:hypothetical protein